MKSAISSRSTTASTRGWTRPSGGTAAQPPRCGARSPSCATAGKTVPARPSLAICSPETSIVQLEGFYALLLGQKVPHRRVRALTAAEEKIVADLRGTHLGQARNGFGVAESLALIRGPHWTWTPGFYQT